MLHFSRIVPDTAKNCAQRKKTVVIFEKKIIAYLFAEFVACAQMYPCVHSKTISKHQDNCRRAIFPSQKFFCVPNNLLVCVFQLLCSLCLRVPCLYLYKKNNNLSRQSQTSEYSAKRFLVLKIFSRFKNRSFVGIA